MKINRPRAAATVFSACISEVLETRRLLSAAARVISGDLDSQHRIDSATQLLRQKVLTSLGVTAADAASLIAEKSVDAKEDAALNLSDTNYWSSLPLSSAKALSPSISAVSFRSFDLNVDSISDVLNHAPADRLHTAVADLPVLMLPTPDGGVARFGMEHYDLLAPSVAAQFPEIRSVRIYGIDDPAAIGTVTLTMRGLTATISTPNGDWSVSPLVQGTGVTAHASYYYSSQIMEDEGADLHDDEIILPGALNAPQASGPLGGPKLTFSIGTSLKTLRLVVGTSAEWTAAAGGQAAAFSMVTSMVGTANVAFLRDICAQLQLVSNTNTIFTDTATDGYTDGNTTTMAQQNQTVMNNAYGFANYDVGHCFGSNVGSGVAITFGGGVGNVGSSVKAEGASLLGSIGSVYLTQCFQHEMGHQLGASHTWNDISSSADGGRVADSAFEPGPGSTLMSYGGLGWLGNYVAVSDPYYHNRSIDQMDNGLRISSNGVNAGSVSSTGNTVPTVTAPANKTIPANTPFELTATGVDDTTNLTYQWEQFDLGTEHTTNQDPGNGPIIRSRNASTSPTRMFPELADILANRIDADELLPTVARTADPLTFHVTIKDQLGGVNDDSVDLPVVNTGSAFAITTANSAGTSWTRGSTQTITWNVAGTTANGINAATVDIYISYNAGSTFTQLLSDTSNDGSEAITIPANATLTSTARIKVKAHDNYFFDINNAAITITAPANGIWTGLGDGVTWHQATNWTNNVIPGASDDVVINVAANPVILVDQAESVKSIASSEAINVTATGSLSVSNASTFNSPLTSAGTITGAGSITINSQFTWTGGSLTGTGAFLLSPTGVGSVTGSGVRSSIRPVTLGGPLTTTAGANEVLLFSSLTISPTAALDLNDNSMIVDYSGASPESSLRTYLSTGYNAGTWDGAGIRSTSAGTTGNRALGLAEATDLYTSFPATFAGVSVDATSVLIEYTLPGDAELDSDVDTLDFNLLAGSFGQSAMRFSRGDFDYSGTVDSVDFDLYLAQYGKKLPGAAPLPSSEAMGVASTGEIFATGGINTEREWQDLV